MEKRQRIPHMIRYAYWDARTGALHITTSIGTSKLYQIESIQEVSALLKKELIKALKLDGAILRDKQGNLRDHKLELYPDVQ